MCIFCVVFYPSAFSLPPHWFLCSGNSFPSHHSPLFALSKQQYFLPCSIFRGQKRVNKEGEYREGVNDDNSAIFHTFMWRKFFLPLDNRLAIKLNSPTLSRFVH